jgi:hypothetical protein
MTAVADLGVTMGPRNRRRLTKGAIALVVIAAAAATVLLTHAPSHSGPAVSSTADRAVPSTQKAHLLSYGMTKQEVRRLAGPPTSTRGNCWLYHAKPVGMIQSYAMPGAQVVPIKVCFWQNMTEGLYSWFVGPRVPKGEWTPPLVISSNQ